jgi:hypothetical protein
MHPRAIALAALLCAGAFPVHAFESGPAQCRAPQEAVGIDDRAGGIAALERMPDSCLKEMMMQCGDSANQRLLDLGTAAMCSMGYEALMRKSFGGNFRELMAWWRSERAARTQTP